MRPSDPNWDILWDKTATDDARFAAAKALNLKPVGLTNLLSNRDFLVITSDGLQHRLHGLLPKVPTFAML